MSFKATAKIGLAAVEMQNERKTSEMGIFDAELDYLVREERKIPLDILLLASQMTYMNGTRAYKQIYSLFLPQANPSTTGPFGSRKIAMCNFQNLKIWQKKLLNVAKRCAKDSFDIENYTIISFPHADAECKSLLFAEKMKLQEMLTQHEKIVDVPLILFNLSESEATPMRYSNTFHYCKPELNCRDAVFHMLSSDLLSNVLGNPDEAPKQCLQLPEIWDLNLLSHQEMEYFIRARIENIEQGISKQNLLELHTLAEHYMEQTKNSDRDSQKERLAQMSTLFWDAIVPYAFGLTIKQYVKEMNPALLLRYVTFQFELLPWSGIGRVSIQSIMPENRKETLYKTTHFMVDLRNGTATPYSYNCVLGTVCQVKSIDAACQLSPREKIYPVSAMLQRQQCADHQLAHLQNAATQLN